MLAHARSPLVAGGAGWTAAACADLQRFAEAFALPVASAFRNQDVFDNDHAHYARVGIGINPKLATRVRDADLLLVIGERLGEMVTAGHARCAGPHRLAGACPAGQRRRVAGPSTLAITASIRVRRGLVRSHAGHPAWAGSAAHADYDAWQAPRAGVGAVSGR
jgi:acetolactate synthase-1/2/3 large subunit